MRIPFWRGLAVAAVWLAWPLALLAVAVPLRLRCPAGADCYYIPSAAEWRLFGAAWLLPAGAATAAWARWRATWRRASARPAV